MAFRPPVGVSNFLKLRGEGATYVDKTRALVSMFEQSSEVTLFTRPRRFGKTLLLSTFEAFLQRREVLGADTTAMFEDLAVWRSEEARAHHQRHAVLTVSFKDVKHADWESAFTAIRRELDRMVASVAPLLDHPAVPTRLRQSLSAASSQTPADLEGVFRAASEALYLATGEPVVILIDEYDAPLHAAWVHGYYEEAIGFFRSLLSGALKDNTRLYRAIITGVMRIVRESLFSGLNNVKVCTVLHHDRADAFGFTEPEVASLAAQAGVPDHLDDLRAWYDGYRFGDVAIYNPWSVLRYLEQPREGLVPYWVNTGATDLIEDLFPAASQATLDAAHELLRGGTIVREVTETLILRDLATAPEALWTLLLATGYLKATAVRPSPIGHEVTLAIPNQEVLHAWRGMFRRWIDRLAHGGDSVHMLTRALLRGDERTFGEVLQDIVISAFSTQEGDRRQSERVWQAFVLGLLAALWDDYDVQSEREAGFGRADVLVRPKRPGLPGAVLELKRREPKEPIQEALTAAMLQIKDRRYAAALTGATSVIGVAVVFAGKRVHVRMERLFDGG